MIIKKMFKIIIFTFLINLLVPLNVFANSDFNLWKKEFKAEAINSGISKKVVDQILVQL